jgi:hypothetical protein
MHFAKYPSCSVAALMTSTSAISAEGGVGK